MTEVPEHAQAFVLGWLLGVVRRTDHATSQDVANAMTEWQHITAMAPAEPPAEPSPDQTIWSSASRTAPHGTMPVRCAKCDQPYNWIADRRGRLHTVIHSCADGTWTVAD